MLYFNFENYEEFVELFGVVEHGNGVKSRRNKILLALYKDKAQFKKLVAFRQEKGIRSMIRYARMHEDSRFVRECHGRANLAKWSAFVCALEERYLYPHSSECFRADVMTCPAFHTSLPKLKTCLMNALQQGNLFAYKECRRYGTLSLNGKEYLSNEYETDDMRGLCEDGTINAIRYRSLEKNRTYKMRAGKMFNHIMDCNIITKSLPEQVRRWLSEEFVAEWIQYTTENIGGNDFTLHFDDNFEDIYESNRCAGYDSDYNSFRSCMVGDGQWTFYRDAVDAKAAYIKGKDGLIYARCIVFTDVHEAGSDKVWRLAERQYSKEQDYALQRRLITMLVQARYIDGYKTVGASCGDSRKFVDNEGNSLEDKMFWIPCRLKDGDTISYQDSFKWYDEKELVATNYGKGDIDLSTTDAIVSFHENQEWSDFNQEYINSDDAYYVETRDDNFHRSQVVEARIMDSNHNFYSDWCYEGDCLLVDGNYYYAGENHSEPEANGIYTCPYCGELFAEHSSYSEVTEQDYCCESCRDDAEDEWYEDNGYVNCEYDGCWHKEEEVVYALRWLGMSSRTRYAEYTISIDDFNELVEKGRAAVYCGKSYIDDVTLDGEPAHIAKEALTA